MEGPKSLGRRCFVWYASCWADWGLFWFRVISGRALGGVGASAVKFLGVGHAVYAAPLSNAARNCFAPRACGLIDIFQDEYLMERVKEKEGEVEAGWSHRLGLGFTWPELRPFD